MICLIDTNTPCLGEGYEGMDSMLDKIREVIKKLHLDAKVACDVKMEFSEFAFSQNSYGDIDALIDKKVMPSVSWRNYHGGNDKLLQTLAVRVPSQVASSSSVERN
eukprot:Gb_19870 [translate_table: standard]